MSHVPIVSKFFLVSFSHFFPVSRGSSHIFLVFSWVSPISQVNWARHSGPRPEGAARPSGGTAGGGGRPRGGRQEEPGAPGIFVDAGDLTMFFSAMVDI